MKNFKSKPFQIYSDAHTLLNNYIKVSAASIDHLYNSKTDNQELSELISQLIINAGERWTKKIIINPKEELDRLKNDLVKTGMIWVYSAFDVFYKQIEGLLSARFKSVSDDKLNEGINARDDNNDERDSKIVELYKKLSWQTDNISNLLPILKFYEQLRHCVAHRSGKTSKKLLEISNSDAFKNAIENWETKFPGKTISNAPCVNDNQIDLKPHHCIIYSETCLRIAKDINQKLFSEFGINHFIKIVVKNHLLSDDCLSIPYCESYIRYLVYHLNADFNIGLKSYKEVLLYTDSKDELERHQKLYQQLKRRGNKLTSNSKV